MLTYGRYEILEEIGRGSMGVVYLAKDPQIDRMIALKVIRKDYANNTYFLSRFYKEAKAIGRLSHPNIVTVYDIGQDHATHFIAMELIPGEPLRQMIKRQRLSLKKTLQIGIKLAEALDFAHAKGIVHRDVKPSNIIVSEQGEPILTDFGLAHVDDPEALQQTRVGEVMGTPRYMSPEQVLGQATDGRSDLYALGVILYELATGKNPIQGKQISAIYSSIMNDVPQRPQIADPTSTAAQQQTFAQIIAKSLQKRPDDRIQTGRQLAEALTACLTSERSMRRKGVDKTAPAVRMLASMLALVLLLVSVGTAGWWIKTQMFANTEVPSSKDRSASNAPAQESWANLLIESDPKGAQVLINGVVKGRAPLSVGLPLGQYDVVLRMAGHFDWEASVSLTSPTPEPIYATLMPLVF